MQALTAAGADILAQGEYGRRRPEALIKAITDEDEDDDKYEEEIKGEMLRVLRTSQSMAFVSSIASSLEKKTREQKEMRVKVKESWTSGRKK